MNNDSETAMMQAKIVTILARVFGLSPEMIKDDVLLAEFFSNNPEGLRSFVVRLEESLKIPLGENAIDSCRTVGELAAYCVAHKASMPSGRLYVVVCRMPGGKICERHYHAKRHEEAAKLAMNDGAEEVLSIEREDQDDYGVHRKNGLWSVLMFPLLLGLLVAVAGVAFFWWRRGCPKFW